MAQRQSRVLFFYVCVKERLAGMGQSVIFSTFPPGHGGQITVAHQRTYTQFDVKSKKTRSPKHTETLFARRIWT